MTQLKLQFNPKELHDYALSYSYETRITDDDLQVAIDDIKELSYLSIATLTTFALWKAPRNLHNCLKNEPEFLKEVSSIALKNKNENLKISILSLLKGFSFPMASVILHFCDEDKYPIIDFRALESLGIPQGQKIDLKLWRDYLKYCRFLSKEHNISMRDLDKALWQHSKSP